MSDKLRTTLQVRHECRRCGQYEVEYADKAPKKTPTSCHWCGRPGLFTLAHCIHKTPYYIKLGPSKPRKKAGDWMKVDTKGTELADALALEAESSSQMFLGLRFHNSRKSGKSTGRPRRKEMDNSPQSKPIVDPLARIIELEEIEELEMVTC